VVLADLTSGGGLTWMKDVALLIFLGLFLGVVVRLLIRGRAGYEAASMIPLSDEVVEPRDDA
jgi:cbb3-type cytochrome oxidase subunit 3